MSLPLLSTGTSVRTAILLLKRIKSLQDGKLLLISDNPEYGDLWLPP
ncbi:MAG: hypothetical protein H7Y04_16225 [Verrucomicrobia bacterium]|nr:hypothetical protein [Cytophagales bacterium]